MYYTMRLFIRVIFLMEIALFVYGYGWGGRGIMILYAYKDENEQLRRQIMAERQVLQEFTDEVVAWKEDPFYKEKYAREQLHMARPDEVIYL